jgi:hypothetical protein
LLDAGAIDIALQDACIIPRRIGETIDRRARRKSKAGPVKCVDFIIVGERETYLLPRIQGFWKAVQKPFGSAGWMTILRSVMSGSIAMMPISNLGCCARCDISSFLFLR